MTDIFAHGTILAIIIIVIYSIKIGIINIYKSKGSLRDSEAIHNYLILTSGILIGIGLAGYKTFNDFYTNFDNSVIGLILITSGILIFIFGTSYIKMKLWKPIEEISEYSAKFSEEFVATRLPLTGAIELKRYAERFNDNILNLAHRISDAEIQLSIVKRSFNKLEAQNSGINDAINSIRQYFIEFENIENLSYQSNQSLIKQLSDFIKWFNEILETLRDQTIELKTLSDTGNLLAINSEIEITNLEIELPSFTVISKKLHELSKQLEEKQKEIRETIVNIQLTYENFERKISDEITNGNNTNTKLNELTINILDNVQSISELKVELSNAMNTLKDSMNQFELRLPNSFLV